MAERAVFRPLVLPALCVVALESFARTAGRHSDSLAAPSAAVLAFARTLGDGSLLSATSFTLASAGSGLLLGSLAGMLLGILIGLSQRAAATSLLTLEVLRPIPSVALIPLAMLIFGFGMSMEVSIVAFATLWPMLILTQAAVRQLDPRLLEVSAALEMGPWERTVKIVLPAIALRLFVALRLGVAVALVVAVTVEIAANPHGMGYALMLAQQGLDPALMLAWLVWIGVVGYCVNLAAESARQALSHHMGGI